MAEVRAAVAADAAGIAAVYAPHVSDGVASFELEPPSPQEVSRRMASGLPWLVAVEDDVVVGYAYASRHRDRAAYRWSVDVSVYLAPAAQGRGLGRALYEPLLAELTDRGFVRAHAGVVLPNDASVALHERLGFARVGTYPQVGWKAGAWHDVLWLSRALAQPAGEPSEPRGHQTG